MWSGERGKDAFFCIVGPISSFRAFLLRRGVAVQVVVAEPNLGLLSLLAQDLFAKRADLEQGLLIPPLGHELDTNGKSTPVLLSVRVDIFLLGIASNSRNTGNARKVGHHRVLHGLDVVYKVRLAMRHSASIDLGWEVSSRGSNNYVDAGSQGTKGRV